jgi:sulfoacetaldehyde dehydrogenase
VGAGNACVVVDETAVLPDVARKVFLSKTFDHATSCSSENSLIIQKSIWHEMITALQAEGGYLCTAEDKIRLKATLWPDSHKLNSLIVARSARTIADMASLQVPDSTRFLMVVGEEPLVKDLFAGEKLSPVVTLWRYDAFAEAVDYVERLTRACGYGHSCGIHSLNQAHIMELATKCHVSRMMVNQPQCYANSGNYDNGMPFTMTLGCGTWGGNITSDNIVWKHFLNTTWVSKPIPAVIPDENEIFKSCWALLGKS